MPSIIVDQDILDYHAFLDNAIYEEVLSGRSDRFPAGSSVFGFEFNQGDIYCLGTPEAVFAMVQYALKYALKHTANDDYQREAYGLLYRSAPRFTLENGTPLYVIWSPGYSNQPRYITLRAWLESKGYSISVPSPR